MQTAQPGNPRAELSNVVSSLRLATLTAYDTDEVPLTVPSNLGCRWVYV